ncbi:MAG: hypothetical protein GY816_05605 [Cytophagales bacterium]|nr:hypothetical protein [Cytophagales bacterium]
MRFPSLFRLPSNQQFEIKPRYYDPVKEFVDQRRSLVKGEKGNGELSRISFERRKTSVGMGTSLLQLIIALVLGSAVVGWLFFGNDILYFGLILVPVYFYFRFRKK